ncbi:rCG21386, isoform CRA_d, partial [Rattus norvegicus]
MDEEILTQNFLGSSRLVSSS